MFCILICFLYICMLMGGLWVGYSDSALCVVSAWAMMHGLYIFTWAERVLFQACPRISFLFNLLFLYFLGVRLSIHEPVPHLPSKIYFARALVTVLSHFKTIHWSNHLVNLRPVLLEIDGLWPSFSRIYCIYHDNFIPPRSCISSKCWLPSTWSFRIWAAFQ